MAWESRSTSNLEWRGNVVKKYNTDPLVDGQLKDVLKLQPD